MKAIPELDGLIMRGRSLIQSHADAGQTHRTFSECENDVAQWIDQQFPGSGHAAEWSALPFSPLAWRGGTTESLDSWLEFRNATATRLEWLSKLYKLAQQPVSSGKLQGTEVSNRVFLVHGHNEAVKEVAARFLANLKLEPIILHEQPDKNRTIIEKFVDYAGVGFAVVLMTADDQGGTVNADRAQNQFRARQNVILEFGYFLGSLGRERVCVIYEKGVELPTDCSGVLWVELDLAGAWKLRLAREVKAAGIAVDLNDAM